MTKTIQECVEEFELLMDYISDLHDSKQREDIVDYKINFDDDTIDLYIIPAKPIEYITFKVNSNTSFEEICGQI